MKPVTNWTGAIVIAASTLLPGIALAGTYDTNVPVRIIEGAEFRQINELLFEAADRGLTDEVKSLLADGASVQARDRFGNTALLRAALSGRHHTVQALLDAGSDINHQNLIGSNAIYRAAKGGRKRSVKVLIAAGADFNQPNDKDLTPLLAAAYNGDTKLVDMFLELGSDPSVVDSYGKSAIIYAAGRGFHKIVTKLLDTGIDVNKRYGNDLTVLMWAAGFSNDVPPKDGEETVRMLIERGADVRLRDNRGWSALSTAAYRNHGGVITQLIAAGASPKVRSKQGKTPLDLARGAQSHKAAQVLAEATGN